MHLSGAEDGQPAAGRATAFAWLRSSPPRRSGRPQGTAGARRRTTDARLAPVRGRGGSAVPAFVLYMCAYAGDVARGELPGPFTDADARRYARACLIATERLERRALDVHSAARALGVPAAELQDARDELLTGATHR
jgi:hypothetical protein